MTDSELEEALTGFEEDFRYVESVIIQAKRLK